MTPTTSKWVISSPTSKPPTFDSLTFVAESPLPSLGDHDVLVQIHYASLNYRDLIIPMGKYSFPTSPPVVPCSDGAGVVVAIGPRVTLFTKGNRVVTTFNQTQLYGPATPSHAKFNLGATQDGVIRQYGVFEETGLVPCPPSLTLLEASTLPCAALTAWNALHGLRAVKPGDWVLTQGTGGVALFGVQLAKAAGAKVIATTSSASGRGGALLKRIGADHVLDYKVDADSWGVKAREITADTARTGTTGTGTTGSDFIPGVDHILEVGGPTSMAQSLAAIKPEGIISVIGFLGGVPRNPQAKIPGFVDVLTHICTVRGVMVGSREQALAMNRCIETCNIKPVVDEKIWEMHELKEAYAWMWEKKHTGKVVIRIYPGDRGCDMKL